MKNRTSMKITQLKSFFELIEHYDPEVAMVYNCTNIVRAAVYCRPENVVLLTDDLEFAVSEFESEGYSRRNDLITFFIIKPKEENTDEWK